jgi:hypothetical protein
MDLLIDAHCHLIRATRSLLAWGTTLQIAVDCLADTPIPVIVKTLEYIPEAGLSGSEEHHLGAAKGLNMVAAGIAEDVARSTAAMSSPTLASIYIAALLQLLRTDHDKLRSIYERP